MSGIALMNLSVLMVSKDLNSAQEKLNGDRLTAVCVALRAISWVAGKYK